MGSKYTPLEHSCMSGANCIIIVLGVETMQIQQFVIFCKAMYIGSCRKLPWQHVVNGWLLYFL